MSESQGTGVEAPGPADFTDATTQRELQKAFIWVGVVVLFVALWFLAQPILLIVGGCVFASMLDGGVRLLGRVTKLGRGVRLAIVSVGVFLALLGFLWLAGSQIAGQAESLRTTVMSQVTRLLDWGHRIGVIPEDGVGQLSSQLMGSFGRVTAAVGTALGAVSSAAMIVVIGLFVAIEPRLYERGVAWLMPMSKRGDFYATSKKMGFTLRRLMLGRLIGMAVEGVFTAIFLGLAGVPMATLLGVLTGLLAFLPNIGAIVSGFLIVLVGFSGGFETGIWAIVVYVAVQIIDGYIVVPMVARRSVDLAPALVLGAQLLFGALFGILGLALADPIVAMLKVLLEKKAELAVESEAVGK